ncbi:MAG: CHAD domain-containing protein [Campylobacterota bacterium]|nr:CHAD domain-containing protein [Campylobacterota bacterium]
MSYSVNIAKNISKQLKKLLFAQLNDIINIVYLNKISQNKKIHLIRQKCKKTRALLLILKPLMRKNSDYIRLDSYIKNIAKKLSLSRDKKVLNDTYKKIIKKYKLKKSKYKEIKHYLNSIKKDKINNEFIKEQLALTVKESTLCKKEIKSSIIKKRCEHNIETVINKLYMKIIKLQEKAFHYEDDEDIHEYRKWVKYYMYIMETIKKETAELEKLTTLLGKYHDITVFKEYLQNFNKPIKNQFLFYLQKEQKYLLKDIKKIAFKIFR